MLKEFVERIERKEAKIGVVGLGYVGLPLAMTYAGKGLHVLGFDIDPKKPEMLHNGQTYLEHIPAERFRPLVEKGLLEATTDFDRTTECAALLLCVPTPLTEAREPDMSFIENTSRAIGPRLRRGQLVSLESTTYPGTTDEVVKPILEGASGLQAGVDFFLVFSPEREDPGNPTYNTANIPKVVGGYSPDCLAAGKALYGAALEQVVPVSSTRAAEMAKILENTYRAINIALVNELKMLCHRLDIDIWEVIEAAKSKPFGFQAFYPGPGLGGHCIPIDPFYLTWKAREVEMATRFIELAGEVNTSMPYYVVERVQDALNTRRKTLNDSSVLILGVAYKPDIDDLRESPALRIIELLKKKGARVLYHDPHVPTMPRTRKYNYDLRSSPLTEDLLRATDCVLVVTHHKGVDYRLVAAGAELVVDTRNVVPRDRGNVVQA